MKLSIGYMPMLVSIYFGIGTSMKIKIPHLGYTVNVRQIKKIPAYLTSRNVHAYVQKEDSNSCTIYLNLKKKIEAGDLAHELIHVLQYICHDRNIDFNTETEHMGYLMHYLMGRCMGMEYDV